MLGGYPNYRFYSSQVLQVTPHSSGTIYPLSEWQGTLGQDLGTLFDDPEFVSLDSSSPEFLKLSAGSPAINTGTEVPVFDNFYGSPRPAGWMWDMGAFEYPE